MPTISGTMHLKIMKGVAKIPGDSQNSERGLDEVDLLDPKGFVCDEYLMKMPTLKSSAVYADSPLTDGRTLISGALGNVTETIRLTLNSDTMIQLAVMLSKLVRFKQDCNDFWDTFGQIEPMYLKHQIVGEPGPRYALLYDIDIDVETPINPNDTIRTVTLSIEREPYWRGLAPGDNPKHWYYLVNQQNWGVANTLLLTGSDHIAVNTSLDNRGEQNTSANGWVTQNFIDISAANIPGDAPALLCLSSIQTDTTVATTMVIGKSTKPNTGNTSRRTGTNQPLVYTFPAADAVVNTDTTLAADGGTPLGVSGLRRRAETTFGTASMTRRLDWNSNALSTNGLSLSVLRGRFAVFGRARVSAAATVNVEFVARQSGVDSIVNTPVVLTDLGAGGTGTSTDWALLNLGQISLPFDNRKTSTSNSGLGVDVFSGSTEIALSIFASRTSGAGLLYFCDLILIPIDEGAIQIKSAGVIGSSGVGRGPIYDNTGYYTHGTPEEFAAIGTYTAVSGAPSNFFVDIAELSGGPLYLTPNVNNRLYFLCFVDSTKRSFIDDPPTMSVRVDIVPRWVGLRTS